MAAQHYWNDDDAVSQITHVDRMGINFTSEEPLWHAWESICQVYFPRNATNPTDPSFTGFSSKRELYRGPLSDLGSKIPDVVTCQRKRIQTVAMRTLGSGPGGQTHNKRDILWVECKAANLDAAFQWKELMLQIIERLIVAHGTPTQANGLGQRKVYFILATGLKWMMFVWDPANTNPPLRFKKNNNEYWPPIHPFVAAVQMPAVFATPPGGVGQPVPIIYEHIRRDSNGVPWIDHTSADTLDYWTAAPGQPGVAANFRSVTLLEVFFAHVRGDVYQGSNPDYWSG